MASAHKAVGASRAIPDAPARPCSGRRVALAGDNPPATVPPAELLAELARAVQHNCDVVDAQHARDSGLCTYLLGMREYFRWVSRLTLGGKAEPGSVGTWITHKERGWEALLEGGTDRLVPLPVLGGLDPYEEEAANQVIARNGLVYGAGIGRFGVPVFFLAQCESQALRDGIRILVAGEEHARGFAAPPALSRGSTIVLRSDALRRWLWTRAEVAVARQPGDAFVMCLRAYEKTGHLDDTIERMARGELETLLLHELGELRAGRMLGPDWECMLEHLSDRRAELVVRAVRDLLADCMVTLPELLERRAWASLQFWYSNFDGMRRALAPQFLDARASNDGMIDREALQVAITCGLKQWSSVGRELLGHWETGGREAVAAHTLALCPA